MIALRQAAGVATMLGWLCGCGGTPQAAKPSGPLSELIVRNQSPIPDVPVPLGFELDEARSRDFASGRLRYADHVYYGSGEKFEVARFYHKHLPANRWVLMTDMFVQAERVLDFEKDAERCRIVVGQGSLFRPTAIKIRLWNAGRN